MLALSGCSLPSFGGPPDASPAAHASVVPAAPVPALLAGTLASGAPSPVAASTPIASVSAPGLPALDGTYDGLAVLTAFHGDCNAGGTGTLRVLHGIASFRDARNPPLDGSVSSGGILSLSSGPVRLTGRFTATGFDGRIVGGTCDYDLRYERHVP